MGQVLLHQLGKQVWRPPKHLRALAFEKPMTEAPVVACGGLGLPPLREEGARHGSVPGKLTPQTMGTAQSLATGAPNNELASLGDRSGIPGELWPPGSWSQSHSPLLGLWPNVPSPFISAVLWWRHQLSTRGSASLARCSDVAAK